MFGAGTDLVVGLLCGAAVLVWFVALVWLPHRRDRKRLREAMPRQSTKALLDEMGERVDREVFGAGDVLHWVGNPNDRGNWYRWTGDHWEPLHG